MLINYSVICFNKLYFVIIKALNNSSEKAALMQLNSDFNFTINALLCYYGYV